MTNKLQREGLFNNIDLFIDAQISNIRTCNKKIFEVDITKTLNKHLVLANYPFRNSLLRPHFGLIHS